MLHVSCCTFVLLLDSADCKRGRRKGATSKNVKKRQKTSKCFSTLFDNFRAGQKKASKIVKKCQKYFRHFSTIFARHHFSGPFWWPPPRFPIPGSGFWRRIWGLCRVVFWGLEGFVFCMGHVWLQGNDCLAAFLFCLAAM